MLRFAKRLLLSLIVFVALSIATSAIYFDSATPRMLLSMAFGQSNPSSASNAVQRLQVPPGFSITVYASGLRNARMLKFTEAGDLLVSLPRAGEIMLLERDRNGDGQPDAQRVLLKGLDRPHGIDVTGGWIYVGETKAVGRIAFDSETGQVRGSYQQIITGLTGDDGHWTKTVRIGPDGFLYLAQGSTCNVCEEKDRRRATIMRFNADGSGGEIYASGLRNSVGMDWAPWSNELYATDNGRDWLGDDFPPCELNRIVKDGFYGWPYINGANVLDPDFGKGREALLPTAIAPAHGFRAHNAPLGIHFLRSKKLPAGFERSALVALHGSWNRDEPDGYKVVQLQWRDDGKIDERDFVTGFFSSKPAAENKSLFGKNKKVIGRPVDVAEGPDGAIYISDDFAGAIYRVAYGTAPTTTATTGSPAVKVDQRDGISSISADERTALSQRGEALYRQYACAKCHEQRFAGGFRKVKPLEQLSARYSMQQLQDFLRTPQPPMPVFPLSDDDRKALAVYLLMHE